MRAMARGPCSVAGTSLRASQLILLVMLAIGGLAIDSAASSANPVLAAQFELVGPAPIIAPVGDSPAIVAGAIQAVVVDPSVRNTV